MIQAFRVYEKHLPDWLFLSTCSLGMAVGAMSSSGHITHHLPLDIHPKELGTMCQKLIGTDSLVLTDTM